MCAKPRLCFPKWPACFAGVFTISHHVHFKCVFLNRYPCTRNSGLTDDPSVIQVKKVLKCIQVLTASRWMKKIPPTSQTSCHKWSYMRASHTFSVSMPRLPLWFVQSQLADFPWMNTPWKRYWDPCLRTGSYRYSQARAARAPILAFDLF